MLGERYVLEERIASGGMASVWRAKDVVLARTVACKLLHPHLAEDKSFVERFRIEALAAARLSHPNIVAIYDTGSDEGDDPKHFIVMEHCSEGTLAQLLNREGPLDPAHVESIGSTICSALAYAHAHEVIHRDIKPHNVLLSEHGSLKVTDFGIAKAAFVAKDITTTGAIIGTVTYVSPEQAQGKEPDTRSDLYTLGIVLYELLVGKPPFSADTDVATALMHVNQAPISPRSIRAGVHRDLDAVIMKALAKDPEDRFDSAEAMRDALGGGPFKAERSDRTQPISTAPAPVKDAVEPMDQPDERPPRSEGRRMAVSVVADRGCHHRRSRRDRHAAEPDRPGQRGRSPDSGGNAPTVTIEAARDFDPGGSPPGGALRTRCRGVGRKPCDDLDHRELQQLDPVSESGRGVVVRPGRQQLDRGRHRHLRSGGVRLRSPRRGRGRNRPERIRRGGLRHELRQRNSPFKLEPNRATG